MSIKRGIKNGDLVYISAISTSDILYDYGGKKSQYTYSTEQERKHSTLVGMVGRLVAYEEPDKKYNKAGFTKAIIKFQLPSNFFKGEDIKYWERHYDTIKNKNTTTQVYDVLFSTGVKLDLVSILPSDLRYGVCNNEMISDFVRIHPQVRVSYENGSAFQPKNFKEVSKKL
tara:strand:- start:17285 stop:17797 length:513 start_codon:yes stop_codon:yes gene_type:complete